MSVTFVIPSINKVNLLNNCLSSLVKYHEDGHEIIVVDDGSTQPMIKKVRSLCERYNALLLINSINQGFAASVNRGIERAKNDIIVLVNNDIEFIENVSEKIELEFKKDAELGIIGCLLFFPNGKVQHGGMVRSGDNFFHRCDGEAINRKEYSICVTGALFVINRKMTDRIGVLNTSYFLSCEDTELCLRAWNNNWRVQYNGSIKAIHLEGATRGNTDIKKVRKSTHWASEEKKSNLKLKEYIKKINISDIELKIKKANQLNLVSNVILSKDENKRIGFYRKCGMGDVILLTGVLREFKKRYPNYTCNVGSIFSDIFNNNPNVENRYDSLQELINNSDKIFNLDLVYESVPKIPIVDAYWNYIFGEMPSEQDDLTPELFSDNQSYNFQQPTVAIHLGRSWQNRTWPKKKWENVIDALINLEINIITIGNGDDYISENKNVINLVGKLAPLEVFSVIQNCAAVACVDSGILHIASCTNTPIVGIFTCANPVLRVKAKGDVVALIPKCSCRFCLHEIIPPVTFCDCTSKKKYKCLDEIHESDVIKAVIHILNKKE